MRQIFQSCCISAFKVSAVVGTALSLINQTHQLLTLNLSSELLLRLFLNYLVPFLVASYSRYSLLRELEWKD